MKVLKTYKQIRRAKRAGGFFSLFSSKVLKEYKRIRRAKRAGGILSLYIGKTKEYAHIRRAKRAGEISRFETLATCLKWGFPNYPPPSVHKSNRPEIGGGGGGEVAMGQARSVLYHSAGCAGGGPPLPGRRFPD